MSRFYRRPLLRGIRCAAVVALAATVSACDGGGSSTENSDVRVHGIVTDATSGEPVVGALVGIWDIYDDDELDSDRTSADGHYEVTATSICGLASLRVDASGYTSFYGALWLLAPETGDDCETVEDLELDIELSP